MCNTMYVHILYICTYTVYIHTYTIYIYKYTIYIIYCIYIYEIIFPFVKEDYVENLGNIHNKGS